MPSSPGAMLRSKANATRDRRPIVARSSFRQFGGLGRYRHHRRGQNDDSCGHRTVPDCHCDCPRRPTEDLSRVMASSRSGRNCLTGRPRRRQIVFRYRRSPRQRLLHQSQRRFVGQDRWRLALEAPNVFGENLRIGLGFHAASFRSAGIVASMIARAKEMTSAAIEAAARNGAGRRGQCAETISRGGVSRARVSSPDGHSISSAAVRRPCTGRTNPMPSLSGTVRSYPGR